MVLATTCGKSVPVSSTFNTKRIIHRDLHAGNILLKYKPDGTKVCMICDFGISVILRPEEDMDTCSRSDVAQMSHLLSFVMHDRPDISEEAKEVIRAGNFSDD